MKPFGEINLGDFLRDRSEKMKKAIALLSNEEIMANDLALLVGNFYEQFFMQPVTIAEEDFSQRVIVQSNIKKRIDPLFRDVYHKEYIEVDGVVMTFLFPYIGETVLFRCQASKYSLSGYPDITIEKRYIRLVYEKSLQEMEKSEAKADMTKALSRDIGRIRDGIEYANSDLSAFNNGLRSTVLAYLTEKKKKVETFFSVSSMFEVPIRKNEYSETHIPLKRNIAPIVHTYDKQKSYCITDADYKDILETIKHTGSTYERTPSSYRAMHEEDLRNILLATLNVTYKGDATGEAFRNNGKTDICIERENRAAFVAECKMWTGPKEMEGAIKQLDSYLTWRDCKTSLIYFVRKKDFIGILTTAEATLKTIPSIRQLQVEDKNEFMCYMISESNPGQIVYVSVMLFNLTSNENLNP